MFTNTTGLRSACVVLAVMVGISACSIHADIVWTGAAGDGGNVLTSGNWDGSACPGSTDVAQINDAPEAKLTSGSPVWQKLTINPAASKTGMFTVYGGDLTLQKNGNVGGGIELKPASGGNGVLNVNGGSLTMVWLNTYGGAGRGTVNITSGMLKTTDYLRFGGDNTSGTTVFCQTGGDVEVGGNFYVGYDSAGTGEYNMNGGTLKVSGNDFAIAQGKSGNTRSTKGYFTLTDGEIDVGHALFVSRYAGTRGFFTQVGGEINFLSAKGLTLGVEKGSAGTFVQTGGSVTLPNNGGQLYIGGSGRGTFDLGGTVTLGSDKGAIVGNNETASGELRLRDGGTLTAYFIKKNNANARSGVAFGAGTLNATADNATFISGLDGLVFDPGSFSLNTAYNVAMSGCAETFASSQSEMRKAGVGTFTVDRLPPVGNLSIEEGTVALSADNLRSRSAVDSAEGNVFPANSSEALKADDYLLHRWNFNGHGLDLVGTNHASLVGSGSLVYTNSNAEVLLPGGNRGVGWIDCGANVIPSELGDTPFTIELWVTPKANVNSAQWFALGQSTDPSGTSGMTSGLLLTPKSANGNYPHFNPRGNSNNINNTAIGSSVLTLDRKYHVAAVVVPNGDNSATITCYIEDTSGEEEIRVSTVTAIGWSTSTISKENFWLGHSHWNDKDVYSSYDEVRIWAVALSQAQVAANGVLGPDALPVLSETANQGVAENVSVSSGATFDLGGHALVQPCISGSGTVRNGSLIVTKKLSPGGDGNVGTLTLAADATVSGTMQLDVGDCIEVSGLVDLRNVAINLARPKNAVATFTFMRPAAGTSPTIVGAPFELRVPGGYRATINSDGTGVISKVGFIISFH